MNFKASLFTGPINATFFKDVNIIVGANGSGKTLLLEALAKYAKKQKISYASWDGLFEPHVAISSVEKERLLFSFAKMLGMEDERIEKGTALWGYILFAETGERPADKSDKWDKWNE